MNQHDDCETEDSERESLDDIKRKEFAIRCREVRLFIASHPGIPTTELYLKFGKRITFGLKRMLDMGIIKREQVLSSVGITTGWYVVPQ